VERALVRAIVRAKRRRFSMRSDSVEQRLTSDGHVTKVIHVLKIFQSDIACTVGRCCVWKDGNHGLQLIRTAPGIEEAPPLERIEP